MAVGDSYLHDTPTTRGRQIWVDLEDIVPSARWMEEIHIGLTEADAVAFVISPDSIARPTPSWRAWLIGPG